MNTVLWIVQVLTGLAFIAAGVNHAFRYEAIKQQSMMTWGRHSHVTC